MGDFGMALFLAILTGNLAGFLIGRSSWYYTAARPMRRVADAARTGPATNVITALAVGMESCAAPLLVIVIAIGIAFNVRVCMALRLPPLECWQRLG